MKKLILSFILLVLSLITLTGCQVIIENDALNNIKFEAASFEYDGNPHSIYVSNLPLGYDVVYTDNNQVLPGEYYVFAEVTLNFKVVLTLRAKLTITGEMPPHTCGHKCPTCNLCLDQNCTDPACANKCAGHGTTVHTCSHKCPTCNLCLDANCTDPACANKCAGHGTTQHTCSHKCPDCGLCLDQNCTDSVCSNKCPGHSVTPAGTKTVAEMISLMANYADEQVSEVEYTVTGKAISSTYDSSHNSYSVYLETGSNEKFMLYSAQLDSSITGDFTAANAFAGYTVVCTGYAKLHKNNDGTYIYELAYIKAKDSSPKITSATKGTTPVTPTHTCAHVCPDCGLCLDQTCTNEVCSNKCPGHSEIDPITEKLNAIQFENKQFSYTGDEFSLAVTNMDSMFTVEYNNNGKIEVGTYTVSAYIKNSEGTVLKTLQATLTITAVGNSHFDGPIVDVE